MHQFLSTTTSHLATRLSPAPVLQLALDTFAVTIGPLHLFSLVVTRAHRRVMVTVLLTGTIGEIGCRQLLIYTNQIYITLVAPVHALGLQL